MVVAAGWYAWSQMTPAGHSAIMLRLAYWLGPFIFAILLGGIWGWIRYSLRAWANAATALSVLFAILMVVASLPKPH